MQMQFASSGPGASCTPDGIELIFLGTGTSSSLPQIQCITAGPNDPVCNACLSSLTPGGQKNARRNTSAAIRVRGADGQSKTMIIDVGKTFLPAALEWFPKYGMRKIDAVLLTHAHADAMNGLDDLRGWTLNQNIQPHVDIYASQATYSEVGRSFPYLVAKEFASGGGDVPEFKWHIIDDRTPFEVCGITVTPFSVPHGRIFSTSPAAGYLPTPQYTEPTTPVSGRNTPLPPMSPPPAKLTAEDFRASHRSKIEPYLCMGFKIQDKIVYISDVSHIPEDVWPLISTRNRPEEAEGRIPLLVLDCLRISPHTSHFGLKQAVETVRRLNARRSYFVGFTHDLTHEEYSEILASVLGEEPISYSCAKIEKATELVKGEGKHWVQPAHDGLRLFVSEDDVQSLELDCTGR